MISWSELNGTISAGGTEAVMHSIQPRGIDPIIPLYCLSAFVMLYCVKRFNPSNLVKTGRKIITKNVCFWYFVRLSRWKEFHLLQQMDQNWMLSGESIQLNHFPSCELSRLNRKINRRRNVAFVQQTLGMTMPMMTLWTTWCFDCNDDGGCLLYMMIGLQWWCDLLMKKCLLTTLSDCSCPSNNK